MSPLANSLVFLQTQPDARLVSLARAGHERAFEALVRRYRRPLLAYCRRIVASETNAEDILQQALMQAWTALRDGVEVREPRAWLYRIVHNMAASDSRRMTPHAVELCEFEGAPSADSALEQRMVARAALEGLAALPSLQRQAMVGTAVDGLSHEEVARELGLTSGAVRGLIYRARSTLRSAAATLIPGPVLDWAVRCGTAGSPLTETAVVTGGGSAGLGAVLLKGGAVAMTAGALVTGAGITVGNALHGHHGAHALTRAEVGSDGRPPTRPSPTRAGDAFVPAGALEHSTARDRSAGAGATARSSTAGIASRRAAGDRAVAGTTQASAPGRSGADGAGTPQGLSTGKWSPAPSGRDTGPGRSTPGVSSARPGRYGEGSSPSPRPVSGSPPPFGSGASRSVSARPPASSGAGSAPYGGSYHESGTSGGSGSYAGPGTYSGSGGAATSYRSSGPTATSASHGGSGPTARTASYGISGEVATTGFGTGTRQPVTAPSTATSGYGSTPYGSSLGSSGWSSVGTSPTGEGFG